MTSVRICCVAMACLFFSSCAGEITCSSKYAGYSSDEMLVKPDMKPIFDDIARSLCDPDSCAGQNPQNTLLVTDFVDIQSLKPGRAGFLMGELMRGGLNSLCCSDIIQGEFSKFFKLSDNGLVALTRNPKEIHTNEYRNSDCIVGTYSYSIDKLYLFVRKIDIYTGVISKFISREISFTCPGDKVVTQIQ